VLIPLRQKITNPNCKHTKADNNTGRKGINEIATNAQFTNSFYTDFLVPKSDCKQTKAVQNT